jgi:hypothetical protein
MRKQVYILAAILVAWAFAAVLFSDVSNLRLARVTATPTRTPRATYTVTATPTITLVPSATPTPSNTPTFTPVPSDTPLPTATATPTLAPTDTPSPTREATATRRAAPPAPVRPTNTPRPRPTSTPAPPFTGRIINGYANCNYAGVTGLVKGANGQALGGVAVGVWAGAWEGRVSVSEPNGKFDLELTGIQPGTFQVVVVRLETCSQQDGRPTAKNCKFLSNIVNVSTTANCQGEGANQVTEVEFVGP